MNKRKFSIAVKLIFTFLNILLLFTLVRFTTQAQSSFELIPEGPIIIDKSSIKTCVVGGCSNELCVNPKKGPIYSTCEWRDEYACYRYSECKVQDNNECGWTMTTELKMCLGEKPKPTQPPTPPSTCGNSLCEKDEETIEIIQTPTITNTPTPQAENPESQVINPIAYENEPSVSSPTPSLATNDEVQETDSINVLGSQNETIQNHRLLPLFRNRLNFILNLLESLKGFISLV